MGLSERGVERWCYYMRSNYLQEGTKGYDIIPEHSAVKRDRVARLSGGQIILGYCMGG